MMMKRTGIVKLVSLRVMCKQQLQESRALLPKEYDLGAVNPAVELPGDRLYASGYLVGQSLRARSAV